jgi:diguanylate cyclase (GGDEF)-like protein/PAS domain S-box-containing protein
MTQQDRTKKAASMVQSKRSESTPTTQGDVPQLGKDKYRSFIENLPVLFYAVSPDPPYSPIYVSPAFEMFGYPLEEWLTNPDIWINVIHIEDRDRIFNETVDSTRTGKNVQYEYRVTGADGTVRWVRDRGCLIRDKDGKVTHRQGVIADITLNKLAEEEVEKREKLYRTLARNIPGTGVLLFDRDLRYTLAEGEQLKRQKFAQDELEGRTIWEAFPKKIADEWAVYYERALTGEHISFERNAPDGWYQIDVLPVRDENGEIFAGMVMWQDITDRKRAVEAFLESESRYRNLFENANDIIYVHDLDGNYISINHAGEKVFGYTREETLKMNMSEIAAPESFDLFQTNLSKKVDGGAKQTAYEVECLRKDKSRVTLEVNSTVIMKDGVQTAVQGIARDITDRKRAEAALKESESRFRDLFENANDLIYTHDLQGNFTSLNRAGERITGYSREEALTMRISQVVAPDYIDYAQRMTMRKLEGEVPTSYELEIIAKSGHRVMLELSTRLINHNGKPVGVQGIGRDITSRRQAEEQLMHNALHDSLTDLPNRTEFMRHLQDAIEQAKTDPEFKFAVLFLDLDRFKIINDSLGHVIGDKLLIGIAKRLKTCVRPRDIVARFGGDEFTILLNKINEASDVTMVAERLQRKLSAPFKFGNYEVFSSASIGIIVSDEIERDPEDFLRDADTAMYRAKESGKARCEVFDREMHARNMNLLQVETDLRRAISRGEFEVFYQPIVGLDGNRSTEFEALIRWNHPTHGYVAPNEFISVAEESGLIIPIGRWILEEACRQTSEWQRSIVGCENLSISVNISARQLMHPTLRSQVEEILKTTGLNARCLKLEVTESTVIERSETALAVLSEMRELGLSLSMDDFGTGYSSLSYLHQFPFERLKIDRSFVDKMDHDPKSEAIVRTILLLGKNLNMQVVAEGIESARQLELLRDLQCELGQGFYFSRPMSAPNAEKYLIERQNSEEDFTTAAYETPTQLVELTEIQ